LLQSCNLFSPSGSCNKKGQDLAGKETGELMLAEAPLPLSLVGVYWEYGGRIGAAGSTEKGQSEQKVKLCPANAFEKRTLSNYVTHLYTSLLIYKKELKKNMLKCSSDYLYMIELCQVFCLDIFL
jgi:hypothetical protein